ncbi:hypothetical protein F5X96DRAFT_622182 [Biscogniauxia mediterranea]|nr:hypothetical protein F5X96DRAFT_622182 [Biscogniauxia mediterranea]
MAPPGWIAVQPTGLASAILGVTLTFSILCTVVMVLRVYTRIRMSNFALEDWLMCVGYVINMAHNAVISYGTFTGLGSHDDEIPGGATGATYMEGIKSVFLWQIFFLSGFVFIKCSICLTLLRIAVIKWHRITFWILIVISILSALVVDIYVLIQCRPIERTWGEKPGTCIPIVVSVAITFVISAFNIITDVTTALLPFLMLKRAQMARRKKLTVIAILSLGVLASIATIARLPFGTAYFATKDYLVGLGDIILWTVVECDLALIAGSLPMLAPLFRGLNKGSTGDAYKRSTELGSMGHTSRKGYTRQEDDPSESSHKSESMRGIMVKQDHVLIHEDNIDGQELSVPSYSARTYV